LDFVSLIYEIDTLASKYGISIDKTTSRDTDSSAGTSIEAAAASKPYNSSIIGFSFTASYQNFKDFIKGLEKSLRILDIKTLKINPGENGLYSFSVEFETYFLK